MKPRRLVLYVVPVALPALVVALLFLACCGGSFTTHANQSLKVTLEAVNAASEGFVAWNRVHEEQILAASTSQEQYDTAVAAYRGRRAAVTQALVAAYSSIAAAAALVPLVAGGKAGRGELVAALAAVAAATIDVKRAIDAIRGSPASP